MYKYFEFILPIQLFFHQEIFFANYFHTIYEYSSVKWYFDIDNVSKSKCNIGNLVTEAMYVPHVFILINIPPIITFQFFFSNLSWKENNHFKAWIYNNFWSRFRNHDGMIETKNQVNTIWLFSTHNRCLAAAYTAYEL